MEVQTDVQVHMVFIQNIERFDNLWFFGIMYKEIHAIHFNATINLYIEIQVVIIYMMSISVQVDIVTRW